MSKLTIATIAACFAVLGLLAAGTVLAGPNADEAHTPSRTDKIVKTEAEWKAELTADEFRVLREKGTERAFTSEHLRDHKPGVYTCAACGLELFDADTKFDSGTGWPSYFQPVSESNVDTVTDYAFGMARTEVLCARCGGHLGHVFADGPKPTGLRYCINGDALDKQPKASN